MALSITEILNDNTSGSFSLTMNTLKLFSDYIEQEKATENPIETIFEAMHTASKNLIKHQSNMVLLRKACNTYIAYFKRTQKSEKPRAEVLSLLQEKITQIKEDYHKNLEIIALSGSKIIANFNKIMSFSNSTVVKKIFEKADFQKRKFDVFCLKSDPPGEGMKLAETLSMQGIKTTVVADSQAGVVMDNMNIVIVGADRLYETGFVNKSGTLALCLLARHFNIPVYLAVETTKILKESERSIKEIERDVQEVYNSDGNISVINSYYEKIPLSLIHKVISEQGVFETPEFSSWYLGE